MNSQEGVHCNRIYSSDIAVVECTNLDINDISKGAATSLDCFHDSNTAAEFHALKGRRAAMNNNSYTIPSPSEHANAITGGVEVFKIRGRQTSGFLPGQGGSCAPNPGPSLVGDGNPHQNYFHKQLSVSFPFLLRPASPL
jgi:hypothetical protein